MQITHHPYYEVFPDGKIYSSLTGQYLSPILKHGYLYVDLGDGEGDFQRYAVHRLVAEAFIPNPSNLPCVNHKNHDRSDNRQNNLEWCSQRYNAIHGRGIPVMKCNVNNHEPDEWFPSASIASELTGTNKSSICNCIKGKRNNGRGIVEVKSAGGFWWRKATNEETATYSDAFWAQYEEYMKMKI